MISEITFVTNNKNEFADAYERFRDTGIKLLQESVNIIRIQSQDLNQVSEYAAEYAGVMFETPLFVIEKGLYIDALNEFPGPFVNHISKYFAPQDILKLLERRDNRKCRYKICISLFVPENETISFNSFAEGSISTHISKNTRSGLFESLFIPDDTHIPLADYSQSEATSYWNNMECWKNFIKHLKAI